MPTYTIKTLDDAQEAHIDDDLVEMDNEFVMENPRGMIFTLRVARNNADLPRAWLAVQGTANSDQRYNQCREYFRDIADKVIYPRLPDAIIEISLAGFRIMGGGEPLSDDNDVTDMVNKASQKAFDEYTA